MMTVTPTFIVKRAISLLPDGAVQNANHPQVYENARLALSECDKIDECKSWADKAAALASYAKQADDESLEQMAQRIRLRAVRRIGELITEIEPAKNQHDASARVGCGPSSRIEAAREAGISDRQQKNAIRLARIPQDDFDQQVEAAKPPTVTVLARQGTIRLDTPYTRPDPEAEAAAQRNRAGMRLRVAFSDFLREVDSACREVTPTVAICALTPPQRQLFVGVAAQVDLISKQIGAALAQAEAAAMDPTMIPSQHDSTSEHPRH